MDILENNLSRMSAYCRQSGLKLRPHTKTHKIPEIARQQIDSGAYGITVAKLGEAEVMAAAGLENILIAYPMVGKLKLERLAVLARAHHITVALDSEEALEGISLAASAAGSQVDILVECDLGMRRCGVQLPDDALKLAKRTEQMPGIRFAGILFYPGNIRVPPAEQSAALEHIGAELQAYLSVLAQSGFSCEVVSGGSTPTAYHSHLIPGMTEIRCGTYVFNDRNTLELGACRLDECALQVICTVISTAVPGKAMIDGGSKTFSSDRLLSVSKAGHGWVVENPALKFDSMSEEHGHLDLLQTDYRPQVGDRLSIIPNHVCSCVNLHDTLWYHRRGQVEGCWSVAGRGKVR
jgi:D-serine deaminase-like pyridoxal phosphate-dependent protein